MQIFELLKIKKPAGLIIILILIFSIVMGGFYYLNTSTKTSNNSPASSVGTYLKGYATLKQEVYSLQPVAPSKEAWVNKLIKNLSPLEDNNLSDKNKYNTILLVSSNLSEMYSETHDVRVRKVYEDLNSFAKENFSKYYNQNNFYLKCQDQSCQNSQQPQEILNIVYEIKSSSVSDNAKNIIIQNLLNVGYLPDNDSLMKASLYFTCSSSVRHDGEFIKADINTKIADEIYNYIIKTYPNEAKQLNLSRAYANDIKF